MNANKHILHGSFMTDNFGDVLLAKVYLDQLGSLISRESISISGCTESNALELGVRRATWREKWFSRSPIVFAGGGYLGEPGSAVGKWTLRFWMRHLFWMSFLALTRRKYCILAAGFGPISNRVTRKFLGFVTRKCDLVALRDPESVSFAIQYSKPRKVITEVADAILSCESSELSSNLAAKNAVGVLANQKKLVVHLPGGVSSSAVRQLILKKVSEAFKDGWVVVLCTDSGIGRVPDFFDWYPGPCEKRSYAGVQDLLGILSEAEAVITTKLHVGICSSVLNKRVLSFYNHPKTPRLYSQLGRPELCMPLEDAAKDGSHLHERLSDVARGKISPVIVPAELRAAANKTWVLLDEFVT